MKEHIIFVSMAFRAPSDLKKSPFPAALILFSHIHSTYCGLFRFYLIFHIHQSLSTGAIWTRIPLPPLQDERPRVSLGSLSTVLWSRQVFSPRAAWNASWIHQINHISEQGKLSHPLVLMKPLDEQLPGREGYSHNLTPSLAP